MRILIFTALAGLTLSACKSTGSATSTKGLDALTGEKSDAVCSGDISSDFSERYDTFWSRKSIDGAQGYQNNLKKIFAAVPLQLQSWFFLKGGKVQLIGNPAQFCGGLDATNLYRADGSVGGCLHIPRSDSLASMPVIYVGISGADYQTQMQQASLIVQGFAALTSSFVTEVALAENLTSNNELLFEFGTYDVEMRNVKAGMAFMVIDDLINNKNSEGKTYAEGLSSELKSMVASSRVLDGSVDRDTRWKGFWESYNSQGHREFTNFAVAQVLDSAWCSDKTRESLFAENALFRRTGKYFKAELEPMLAGAFNGNDGGNNGTNSGSSGNQPQAASLVGTDEAPAAGEVMSATPDEKAALGLNGYGRPFPVLGAVLRAPFAVGAYFVQNRPVATWFATHQPVRRVMWGTARAVGTIVRGTAIVTGRVAGRVVNVVGGGLSRIGYRVSNGCFIRRWRC
jgi:hypothetical protein